MVFLNFLGKKATNILKLFNFFCPISRIEHGDGGQKYIIVSGKVEVPDQNLSKLVVIVTKKLQPTLEVSARMTESMTILTAVAYSTPFTEDDDINEEALRKELVTEAINVRNEAIVHNNRLNRIHSRVVPGQMAQKTSWADSRRCNSATWW